MLKLRFRVFFQGSKSYIFYFINKLRILSNLANSNIQSKKVQFTRYKKDEKILIPVLTYGPNNQLRGFREAIFVAEALNRTVIGFGFKIL